MLISAASLHSRLVQLAIAAVFLTGVAWLSSSTSSSSYSLVRHFHHHLSQSTTTTTTTTLPPKPDHPIDRLIQQAEDTYQAAFLGKEASSVHDAAEAYRLRRGRQPPPHFDKWFAYASEHSAVVVEDFFDRIYHDLSPYWGIAPRQIREQASAFVHRIAVRGGNVTGRSDIDLKDRPWITLWSDMVQTIAKDLPDMDLPINVMDESRIVVPWEEINAYMDKDTASKRVLPPSQLKRDFHSLNAAIKDMDSHPPPDFDPAFQGTGPYWQMAVVGCHPESPARKQYIETDFSRAPPLSTEFPSQTYEGYVQNWTFAQSPCENPHFQGLHGSFVEPISISNTNKLFPLFGGSKLPMNNEILLPPAMYWTKDPFYSGGEGHGNPWEEKHSKLIWRGSASGGRNKRENWTRFQRHRFVSMVNASNIKHHEQSGDPPAPNFVLPARGTYDLAVHAPSAPIHAFSEWVKQWADAAVVHLQCFPGDGGPYCDYTDQYFSVAPEKPMQEQYLFKYLPDIDGNSFSGRYRGFLGSTSLPIKATIYQEWHDSRLIPWKHFVPMDNTFIDIYGIMEYFVGNEQAGLGGHDEAAKKIALEGKEWAEKVLRPEDMSVYVFRLLLEYARICSDERHLLGWSETRHQAGVETGAAS